jgi:hypothetical protein
MNLIFDLLPAAAIVAINAVIWACLLLAAKTDKAFGLGGHDPE